MQETRKQAKTRQAGSPRQSGESEAQPFAVLTPETLLDALEQVGLRADGRLIALNSYENRVYQFYEETENGSRPCVVKFYRPGRWSDAAILEEHAFCRELAERE